MEPRRPDLAPFAGKYVALRVPTDDVVASADTALELLAILEKIDEEGLSIMRAPRADEPVYVGLG